MFPRRSTALAAAITFVLAACGGGSADEPTAAPSPSATPTEVSTTPADAATDSESGPLSSTTEDTPADAGSDSTAAEPGSAATAPPTAGSTDASGTPAARPDPTVAPFAVPAALDFSATTIDGSEVELGQFAGRPVLLWFWAPW